MVTGRIGEKKVIKKLIVQGDSLIRELAISSRFQLWLLNNNDIDLLLLLTIDLTTDGTWLVAVNTSLAKQRAEGAKVHQLISSHSYNFIDDVFLLL